MNLEHGYFIILMAANIITAIIIFLWLNNWLRNKSISENWTFTAIVAVAICGVVFWGLIPCNTVCEEVYTPIPSSKVEVYKTPVMYVVDIDKEKQLEVTSLEECRLFDNKDSLYYYKYQEFDFYGFLDKTQYIYKRKPIQMEEQLN